MMYNLLRDMHVEAFGHKVVYAICINMQVCEGNFVSGQTVN